jgi:hypothetical protein
MISASYHLRSDVGDSVFCKLCASKCGLSTTQLPSSILDVIDSLTKAGYEAYIVGGGVRDLMLGLNPKILMPSPMLHLLR